MWTKDYTIELLNLDDIADEMSQNTITVVSNGGDHQINTWLGADKLQVLTVQGIGSRITVLRKLVIL